MCFNSLSNEISNDSSLLEMIFSVQDLRVINNMLHKNEKVLSAAAAATNGQAGSALVTGKRLALSDDGAVNSPAKRVLSISGLTHADGLINGHPLLGGVVSDVGLSVGASGGFVIGSGGMLQKRLEELISERQATNSQS